MATFDPLPDPAQVSSADAAARLAQAQAANAAWRSNTGPVLPRYGNPSGITQEEQADAAREQAKHMAAFHPEEYYGVSISSMANVPLSQTASRYGTGFSDIVQGYYTRTPTSEAQAINQAYAYRQAQTIGSEGVMQQREIAAMNPYDPNSAAGIAWLTARQGGVVSESLGLKAISEGYKGDLFAVKGMSTVPTRDYSSGMMSGTKLVAALPDQTVTTYMPYGEYAQIKLENTKILMGYNTGELGVYQQPYGRSIYNLVGGAGRNALQSGMFTVEKPETPFVVSQGEIGTYVLPSGKGMSRLGAEAYGGYVTELSGRTLEPTSKFSQYENVYNRANYVNPQGPNLGKAAAPGANIPYTVEAGSPAMSYMDTRGAIPGSGIAVPVPGASDRLATVGFNSGLEQVNVGGNAATQNIVVPFSEHSKNLMVDYAITKGLQSIPIIATAIVNPKGIFDFAASTYSEVSNAGTRQGILKIIQETQTGAGKSEQAYIFKQGAPLPTSVVISNSGMNVDPTEEALRVFGEGGNAKIDIYHTHPTEILDGRLSLPILGVPGTSNMMSQGDVTYAKNFDWMVGNMGVVSKESISRLSPQDVTTVNGNPLSFAIMDSKIYAVSESQIGAILNPAQQSRAEVDYISQRYKESGVPIVVEQGGTPPRLIGGKTVASVATVEDITGAPIPPSAQPLGFFDQLTSNVQTALRTTVSAGGMFPTGGIAVDTAFAVAMGKPQEAPLYEFASSLSPLAAKPAITEGEYGTQLAGYNAGLAKYNADLATYKAGGSTDAAMYQSLEGRYAGLQTEQKSLEKNQSLLAAQPTLLGKIGTTYESLNKGLAPYTTDITGLGRTLEATPDLNAKQIGETSGLPYTDVANAAKGFYVGASQHPVDIAATYGGGKVIGIGEGLVKAGVAKAAMSELPVVSTAGRALSTPLAADLVGVAKAGVGAFIVYEAGANILAQPTASGKGEAAGRTAIQFAGFGVGMSDVKMAEPINEYAGKAFFSGKPEMGPIEKAQFKVETTARSIFAQEPGAYREVSQIVLPGRMVEPAVKAEPRFDILSTSGKYAPEIKATIIEQPHSVVGSSALIQQYPESVAAKAGLRIGKDVDVLIESPTKALAGLSKRTGLSVEEANTMMDVHPIPPKYPGLKASSESDINPPESSWLTRVFGDPYRNIAYPRGTSEVITPGKGYTGEITYEGAQVQFGRKASAVALVAQEPMRYGYRAEKDIYDYVTEYAAQKAIALSKGTPASAFKQSDIAMESFMSRKFTYGTVKGQVAGDMNPTKTSTVRDIYTRMYEEAKVSRSRVKEGKDIGGNIEISSISATPERGFISSFGRSAFGGASMFTTSPPYGSRISRAPSPSEYPSYPSSPTPSRMPSGVSRAPSPSEYPSYPSSPTPSRFGGGLYPAYVPPISTTMLRSPYPSQAPTVFSPPSPPSFPSLRPSPPSAPSPTPSSPPISPPPNYPILSPPPMVPPPFGMPGGGAPGGGGRLPRRAAFVETFMMGLDLSAMGRRTKRAKSWTTPKKYKAKKKGGKK